MKDTLIGYRYLVLTVLSFLLVFLLGEGDLLSLAKFAISLSFSGLIVGLVLEELWINRSKFNFVLEIYFSGFLAYLRAFLIAVTTITLAIGVYPFVPKFLRWGWGSLISSGPTNVLLQPFDTMEKVGAASVAQGSSVNWGAVLIVLFWAVLVFILPFWAQTEELIFRKGVNSWGKICVKSLQFGLTHLIVGIPIYMGFVLAVPGFLFAWRYKYVHDRFLKKIEDDELKAQEAGVAASTADHAIYNAILISLLALLLLLGS
ncbi:hypothetical protein [Ancylothrix sp. D3o]|uniref:hypothetical protein n=1 Tax=Ancylothrix sp. D3o TaxID=2953691 RepID=UPI0021BA6EC8|nr:hypothetical protein [Ancylothrix sp. D3o]